MAKALEAAITSQITSKRIGAEIVFKIGEVDRTDYLMAYTVSYDRSFGSASAQFTLNNNLGIFGESGTYPISVGDVVELSEYYEGATTEWKSFYGRVDQRSISNTADTRTIVLSCLDYISTLKYWDINLEVEATKIKVENETLTPTFLSSPNDMYAQVFNFANSAIAQKPAPIFSFKDLTNDVEDPQYDGITMYFDEGQAKIAGPLNARDNYSVIAKSYYFYPVGLYAEDILESVLKEANGYSEYLFGEVSGDLVVSNHLTTTLFAEEATNTDILTADATSATIEIRHNVTSAISAGDTVVYLDSVEGLPTSGSGTINGDVFTWSGISSLTLTGVPSTGSNALRAHASSSVLKYSKTCSIGQVWYLRYSNIQTSLTGADFTIPGTTLNYFDKRFGRIILTDPISLTETVTCNTNYTFKTLQATGIEMNWMAFRPRELQNRYEAIEKIKNYLAPNYLIRTQGDNKIWASYVSQRTTADYTLSLAKSLQYAEDSDLYTRAVLYAKNKNPINLALVGGINYSTTGASYTATANQLELLYDTTTAGWHKFKSSLQGVGRIDTVNYLPIVYINGVQVDNQLHRLAFQPVYIEKTTTTETSGGGK